MMHICLSYNMKAKERYIAKGVLIHKISKPVPFKPLSKVEESPLRCEMFYNVSIMVIQQLLNSNTFISDT